MVTLPAADYEFLDRLITIAFPRMRDFAESPPAPSTAAATTASFKEQIIFPEIEYDKIDKKRGLTSASRRRQVRRRGQGAVTAFRFRPQTEQNERNRAKPRTTVEVPIWRSGPERTARKSAKQW